MQITLNAMQIQVCQNIIDIGALPITNQHISSSHRSFLISALDQMAPFLAIAGAVTARGPHVRALSRACQHALRSAGAAPAAPAPATGGDHAGRPRAFGSTSSSDPFGAPPRLPQRRVVVTGVGVVSPVGAGAAESWAALVAGRVGTRALTPEDLPEVRPAGKREGVLRDYVLPLSSVVARLSV